MPFSALLISFIPFVKRNAALPVSNAVMRECTNTSFGINAAFLTSNALMDKRNDALRKRNAVFLKRNASLLTGVAPIDKRNAAFLKGIVAKEKGAGVKTVAFQDGKVAFQHHVVASCRIWGCRGYGRSMFVA